MASHTPESDRIDLPNEFSAHLAETGNLDRTPDTLNEYFSMFADRLETSEETIGIADMYSEEPTRHEVRLADRIQYSPCVFDALTAAHLEPRSPVTVRSIDPVTQTPVAFELEDDTIHASSETAVLSFGLAPSIPALESSELSLFEWLLQSDRTGINTAFCGYINAFESQQSYYRWETETDGITIAVQPASVARLIRQFLDAD